MKVIDHKDPVKKPEAMTLSFNPMVIWLNRKIEIHIEKGDTLKELAAVIHKHWKFMNSKGFGFAAYCFAIGERRAAKKKPSDWTAAELSQDPKRRYLRR